MTAIRRLTLVLSALVLGFMLSVGHASASDGWSDNYKQALDNARAQHKLVLVDFTGSDWCPWCIKLHDEVFNTPQFKAYAQKNLVLLKIDFPRSIPQSDAVKKQNQELQKKYAIEGYPTILVLDASGKKIGELGYEKGGPNPFLARLQKMH